MADVERGPNGDAGRADNIGARSSGATHPVGAAGDGLQGEALPACADA